MFGGTAEDSLKSMTLMVEFYKSLPQPEQEHLGKYHLGSVFLDCPICGLKGRKV